MTPTIDPNAGVKALLRQAEKTVRELTAEVERLRAENKRLRWDFLSVLDSPPIKRIVEEIEPFDSTEEAEAAL